MRQINYQSIPKTSVSVSHYTRLENIFLEKDWNQELASDKIKRRYIDTLSILDANEQAFFLDLTERFTWITSDKYKKELVQTLFFLCEKNKGKKLYFARCVGKKDLKKNKSSNFVLYLFKDHMIKSNINLSYQTVDDIRSINVSELNNGSALLVLVDDFIGTGKTAMEALEFVYDSLPRLTNDSSIIFLSIASLKEGMDTIRGIGFHLYTSHIFKKGITDFYKGNLLVQAQGQMKSIERKLQVERKFRFGFKRSEALLSMSRCPNNTFPIYWYSIGLAPYER